MLSAPEYLPLVDCVGLVSARQRVVASRCARVGVGGWLDVVGLAWPDYTARSDRRVKEAGLDNVTAVCYAAQQPVWCRPTKQEDQDMPAHPIIYTLHNDRAPYNGEIVQETPYPKVAAQWRHGRVSARSGDTEYSTREVYSADPRKTYLVLVGDDGLELDPGDPWVRAPR